MSVPDEFLGWWAQAFFWSLVFGGPLLYRILRHRWQTRRSGDWPTIEATIQFAEVESLPRNAGHRLSLRYSFFLEEYRSGEAESLLGDEQEAWDLARWVKGRKVLVRYDPKRPDISTIVPESLAAVVLESAREERDDDIPTPETLDFGTAEYLPPRGRS